MKLFYLLFIIIAAGCASFESLVTKQDLSDYKTEQNRRFDLVEKQTIINMKSIDDNNILFDQNAKDIDFIYDELYELTSGYNKLDADMIDYIIHQNDVIQVRE